jgi:putative hemin transport protein
METIEMTLTQRWAELKSKQPNLRIRNAAEDLGVSEAELLATRLGDGVQLLRPKFNDILKDIESLGPVTGITRNNEMVHERKGVYSNGTFNNHVSMFVGEDIDLRIFLSCWKSAFAVQDSFKGGFRKSIQFFAEDGEAVHKIYLTAKSNETAYANLVSKFKDTDQKKGIDYAECVEEKEIPVNEETLPEFKQSWRDLKDTHNFFGLIKKYKLSRTQALENAPDGYVNKVDNIVFRRSIELAAEREIPIMVFVGNQGIIQIHTGLVKKLLDQNEWFNIMDPMFNLHAKENKIDKIWVVRKPTEDGMVKSIEVFNKRKELIVTLFGKRKPGTAELTEWSDLVEELVRDY